MIYFSSRFKKSILASVLDWSGLTEEFVEDDCHEDEEERVCSNLQQNKLIVWSHFLDGVSSGKKDFFERVFVIVGKSFNR